MAFGRPQAAFTPPTWRPARTRSALSNVKITDSESISPSSRRSHTFKYTIGRVGAGEEAQRSGDHAVGNNDFSRGKKNGMWCRMTFLALGGLFQAADMFRLGRLHTWIYVTNISILLHLVCACDVDFLQHTPLLV